MTKPIASILRQIGIGMLCTVIASMASSCSLFSGGLAPMPKRDEGFSYFGPGSERVLKGSVPALAFGEDAGNLDPAESQNVDTVEAILDKLAEDKARQVILAGFANDSGTAEFNRVLGEQRAQSVRVALLAKGIAPERIHTVSYGNELDARTGSQGRRVEVGLVEPEVN